MWQDLVVSLIVALAAGWTVWRVLLPEGVRARLRRLARRDAPPSRDAAAGACGRCAGCGPTGSGCH